MTIMTTVSIGKTVSISAMEGAIECGTANQLNYVSGNTSLAHGAEQG